MAAHDRIYVTDVIRTMFAHAVEQGGPKLRDRVLQHRSAHSAYISEMKHVVGSAQKKFVGRLIHAIGDDTRYSTRDWLEKNTKMSDAADAAEGMITTANYNGDDAWIIGDPFQIALVSSFIVSNRHEFMRMLAGNKNSVAMWTTASSDFDGAGTYRTGKTVDVLDAPRGTLRTWYEILVSPENATWQKSRNASGLQATKTAEEMEDHRAWLARAAQDEDALAKMNAIFNDALKRMPCVKWSSTALKYIAYSDDPQAFIDAFAVASQARDEIRAFDVSGYSDAVRRIDEIYDTLKYKQRDAINAVADQQAQNAREEANRKAIARATNFAQQWMDDNGLDGVSFYVTPSGSYTNPEAYARYTKHYGSSVLTRLQPGAVAVGNLLFPAVNRLPILASLRRNSFIEVPDNDVGRVHSTGDYVNGLSAEKLAEAKRALLTVMRRGLPPEASYIKIYDGNTSYSAGGKRAYESPDMCDVATGNALHGPAKAKATRAENADKYIIFYVASWKFTHSPPSAYPTDVEKRIAAHAEPPYVSTNYTYRLVLPDEKLSMQDVDRAILER